MGNQAAAARQGLDGCIERDHTGCIERILSEEEEDAKIGKSKSPYMVKKHAVCADVVLPEYFCAEGLCAEVTMGESFHVMTPSNVCAVQLSEVLDWESTDAEDFNKAVGRQGKRGLQGVERMQSGPHTVKSGWMNKSVVKAMEARVAKDDQDRQTRADIDAKLAMLVREEAAAVARRDYDAAKQCQLELDALRAHPETLRLLGDVKGATLISDSRNWHTLGSPQKKKPYAEACASTDVHSYSGMQAGLRARSPARAQSPVRMLSQPQSPARMLSQPLAQAALRAQSPTRAQSPARMLSQPLAGAQSPARMISVPPSRETTVLSQSQGFPPHGNSQ